MNVQLNREEFIKEYDVEDGAVILEPFDEFKEAIVGVSLDREHIIYDFNRLVYVIMSNDKTASLEEATEYVEYNIVGTGFSSGGPLFIITAE